MLLLAADENFNGNIVRGLFRRNPRWTWSDSRMWSYRSRRPSGASMGRARRAGPSTHDVSTITRYAYERVQEGQPMPGVFEVSRDLPIGRAIEEILLMAECSMAGEWEGQVRYLPLR